jgi:hypothetical protein
MKKNKYAGLFAALAVSLLLAACDNKDLNDRELSGPEVLVQIHLLGMAEGGEEDVVRSASQSEFKRVSTSVGNGLLLEMRVERDSALLRAKQQLALTSGAYFRVIAVTSAGKYVSHGDFEVGSSVNTLSTFHVPANNTYDFICFSYNSTDYSLLPSGFNPDRGDDIGGLTLPTDNTNDLLWKKQSETVGTSDPSVSFTLEPVMARVKVVVDCSYNGWNIEDIDPGMTLGSVFTGGTVGLVSGTVSAATGTPTLVWITPEVGEVDTDMESVPMLVMPKALGTITVDIPGGIIKRENLSALPSGARAEDAAVGTFYTALAAGSSYNILVSLRTPIFAGSNIYWDGDESSGKLTFDKEDNRGNEGYQGIFFKWGSLVGVSPKGAGTSGDTFDVPVYIPNGTDWIPSSYDAWTEIPYWDASLGDEIDDTRYSEFRGDICQYLGVTNPVDLAGYRLPTGDEFGTITSEWDDTDPTTTPVAGGWVMGSGNFTESVTVANDFGTVNLVDDEGLGSAKNLTMGDIIFPASGHRATEDGFLQEVGREGCYWSCSAPLSTHARFLYFSDFLGVYPKGQWGRAQGFPVRCVKNN